MKAICWECGKKFNGSIDDLLIEIRDGRAKK